MDHFDYWNNDKQSSFDFSRLGGNDTAADDFHDFDAPEMKYQIVVRDRRGQPDETAAAADDGHIEDPEELESSQFLREMLNGDAPEDPQMLELFKDDAPLRNFGQTTGNSNTIKSSIHNNIGYSIVSSNAKVQHQQPHVIRMTSTPNTILSPPSIPPSYHIRDSTAPTPRPSPASSLLGPPATPVSGEAICAVCGDGHAKLHYGVLACYGCKGFFRRTLTGNYKYMCRFGNNCVVDKYQRNSCRSCRFSRCLEVGMDPKAVRPDRDLTGKQKVPRTRKRALDEELINHMMRLQGDDWSRKIPVESKMLLMQLLNIESKVAKGDQVNGSGTLSQLPSEKLAAMQQQRQTQHAFLHSSSNNSNSNSPTNTIVGSSSSPTTYISKGVSLKELFEQKPSLSGKRTEMCYEPYRMARAEELSKIAHRGAIAAVDWVESLMELIDSTLALDTEDKIALVRACYAPLTIFNFSARTAQYTKNPNILCLCSYSYVPRKLPSEFNGSNHLSNNLIDRTLNELVAPLRKLNLREEEVVPLKAIIILNPNAKNLSPEAQQFITELRDKVQDMLYQVVKELYPMSNAASRFGNLLLLLPTITTLSGVMCENMQFCQVFGWSDPLLNELFETEMKTEDSEGQITSTSIGTNCPGSMNMMEFSPMENPAEISLQSALNSNPPSNFTSYLPPSVNSQPDRRNSSTQTESVIQHNYYHHSSGSSPSLTSFSSASCSSMLSINNKCVDCNRGRNSLEDVFGAHDQGPNLGDNDVMSPSFIGSLLDDELDAGIPGSELVSSNCSAANLFDSDLFSFMP